MNIKEREAMEDIIEMYKDNEANAHERRILNTSKDLLGNIEDAMFGLTEEEIREEGQDIVKKELHKFLYGDDEFCH